MGACTNLASMLTAGGGITEDRAEAALLLDRACNAKLWEACTDLGLMRVTKDPIEAGRLFERACEAGSPRGCHRLGLMALEGVGRPRDTTAATTLLKKACGQEQAAACHDLGLIAADAAPPDNVTAARLYERGCELGSGEACISLGGMALKGLSPISQDHSLAHKLFSVACDRGVAAGCFNVALMYERDLAKPPIGDSAVQRYKSACDLGHADACTKAKL